MADLIDLNGVKVFAIKKGGSSMQHRAFSEVGPFDPRATAGPTRYVIFVRNPFARLVSAYNHFIVKHNTPPATFGPKKAFNVWIEWWLSVDPETHDHHLRPQHLEFRDCFAGVDNADLFMAPLEKATETVEHLQRYLSGRRPSIHHPVRHPHAPWPLYYAKHPDLRRKVRGAVQKDLDLWLALVAEPYPVVLRNKNLGSLFADLSN